MAARDLDDLEARVDRVSARVDRQDELIARIALSLEAIVEAVRKTGDLRGPGGVEPAQPHAPETSLPGDEPVVKLVDYAHSKAIGG